MFGCAARVIYASRSEGLLMARYRVELLVKLKIPDVTALTAANALRRRMGYADVLHELRRADYYLFDVEAETEEEAIETVRDIAEHTNLFVNPNKHSFEVALWRPPGEPAKVGHDLYRVRCIVRDADIDRGAALLDDLRRLGYGDKVKGLTAGTLWVMTIRAPDSQTARRIAEEITITRSRTKGLLANPHYQVCEIW